MVDLNILLNTLKQQLTYFLKGEPWAVKLCLDLYFVAQIWDDLIDRDRDVPDQEIHDAFTKALVEIPINPFFYKHINELKPLIVSTIFQWQDSNVLEKGKIDDIAKAYMLRAGIYDIFYYCALIIGGQAWIKEVGPDIRKIYIEKFQDYRKELKKNA